MLFKSPQPWTSNLNVKTIFIKCFGSPLSRLLYYRHDLKSLLASRNRICCYQLQNIFGDPKSLWSSRQLTLNYLLIFLLCSFSLHKHIIYVKQTSFFRQQKKIWINGFKKTFVKSSNGNKILYKSQMICDEFVVYYVLIKLIICKMMRKQLMQLISETEPIYTFNHHSNSFSIALKRVSST